MVDNESIEALPRVTSAQNDHQIRDVINETIPYSVVPIGLLTWVVTRATTSCGRCTSSWFNLSYDNVV